MHGRVAHVVAEWRTLAHCHLQLPRVLLSDRLKGRIFGRDEGGGKHGPDLLDLLAYEGAVVPEAAAQALGENDGVFEGQEHLVVVPEKNQMLKTSAIKIERSKSSYLIVILDRL